MLSELSLPSYLCIKNNIEKQENNISKSKHQQQQKFKDSKKYFVMCDSCNWFATVISFSNKLSEDTPNKKCLNCKKELSCMFVININNS